MYLKNMGEETGLLAWIIQMMTLHLKAYWTRQLICFFPSGKNFHVVCTKDINILLLDSTETIIYLLDNVSEYLKSKGLFPSKTSFFFQSSELLKPSDYDFNMSDSEELPEPFATSAINTRKQNICAICACTY